jgi:hypothetical protein
MFPLLATTLFITASILGASEFAPQKAQNVTNINNKLADRRIRFSKFSLRLVSQDMNKTTISLLKLHLSVDVHQSENAA